MVNPKDNGKTFGESNYQAAYLQGEAKDIAGSDQPVFIDGDLSQLDKPESEQEIRMLIPQGEYECIAHAVGIEGIPTYIITMKNEDEEDKELMERFINLKLDLDNDSDKDDSSDMRQYKVF